MYSMFCKSCFHTWVVSEQKVTHSDNDWFYCVNCGSGNTEVIDN